MLRLQRYYRSSLSIVDNGERETPTGTRSMDRLAVSEFQILLALLTGALHGAAIRDEVATRTGGDVVLGPGTLYTSIKRLRGRGWIEEVPDDAADVRRIYRLTEPGRRTVAGEAARLEQDLAHARRYRLLDQPHTS
jgi:DNA-binding PadR family transcriptional regulator